MVPVVGWLPLGAHNSGFVNFLFVAGIVAVILLALMSMVIFMKILCDGHCLINGNF